MSSYTRKSSSLSFVVAIGGIYHHFQLTPDPSDSPEEYNDNLIRCFQNDLVHSYPWPDNVNWRTVDENGAIWDWAEKPWHGDKQWGRSSTGHFDFVGQIHVFDIDPMRAARPGTFFGEVRAASFAQWDKLIVQKPQLHDDGKA